MTPQSLLRHIEGATRSDEGLAPAVQLTALTCNPRFRPSLIEGQAVDDVIAILVGSPSGREIDAAFGTVDDKGRREGGAPLH